MSMHRPSGCPSCAEPLEEGDRFCGVCGYAVSAAPPVRPAAAGRPVAPAVPERTPEPAPGWGSVTGAAPTLVGDAGGWSASPAEQSAAAAATPPQGGAPWPVAEAPYGAAGQGAPEGPAARYDLRAGAGTPPEGTPWGPPGEPYAAAPSPQAPYGAAPQTPGDGRPQLGAEQPDAEQHGAQPGGAQPDPGPAEPSPAEPCPPGPAQPGAEAAGADPQGAAEGGKTCVACRAGRVDTDGYCEHCGHAQPRERDHVEEELGSVAAVSDRGLRHHRNEDSFAVAATALPDGSAATVAIVCDGVSSASRPDEASAAAAGAANEALLDALPRGAHPQEAMHEAILAAAAAVNALAPETPGAQNAPACTLVGAVVSGGLLTIGWVGDSRAYWVPDDRAALPRRLTEDDSWAAQMVAAGLMGEAEAYADVRAHAITGWLGADAYDLEPHTATFKPDHAGVVVVCTDGLWNYAESAREMAQVLPPDAATRPLHSAQVLVGHALDGGGHDNVTVAVVPFAAVPDPRPAPQAEAGTGAGPEAGAQARAEAAADPHAHPRA
ncbi:protein phosphatase 2C domain-containing protein [Streptomyces sp. NPDC058646]|uniref:protein phosphatase 2C domain-containing protein n=1 Tax=Streptomyces sp. NPDC058646 TaxID=3346574 RepID=UPI003664C5AE